MPLLTTRECRFPALYRQRLQRGFVHRRVNRASLTAYRLLYREGGQTQHGGAPYGRQKSFHCSPLKALSHLQALNMVNTLLCGEKSAL